MKRILLPLALLLTATLGASAGVVSLTQPQQEKLAKLIADDREAGKLFAEIRQSADAALSAQPNPIHFIRSEGKLPGDPGEQKRGRS